MKNIIIKPGLLTFAELRTISREPVTIELTKDAKNNLKFCSDIVQRAVSENRTIYGINTGFGLLANTKIDEKDLNLLQHSIVLSHAAGIGKYLSDDIVRLIMVLKINALARGFSGTRLEVVEFFMGLIHAKVYPCIPEKGSVGASGDLAPLAHLCLPMLSEGLVRYKGKVITAKEGLKIAKLKPINLIAKEGLALLNGTQVSTALGLDAFFQAEDLFASASVIGAMSVEAAMASREPFDDRIHLVRGHQGQIDSAAIFRHLLGENSEISLSHKECEKVQDPYSLRCQPQVMGACLTQMRHAAKVLVTEANGVTDNPIVFYSKENHADFLSGGNFHAEPVAMAADNLALAIAEIGALSERRTALLIDNNLSKLPAFLVKNGGVNSGFMMAQVTAAALASENKSLAHPASVDSLPTSANQEDHVSMATYAARRLQSMLDNSRNILAIEWLAAAQGLDFRLPLRASALIEDAKSVLRKQVDFYDQDRYFAPDIEKANKLLEKGALTGYLQNIMCLM